MHLGRSFLYLVVFLLFPLSLFAGNSLSGRITDTKGTPLEGAIVEIIDLKTGAASDSSGRYRIINLPKGAYLLQVHQLSFATLTLQVTIDGDTKLDIALNESLIEKNEVVVTGSSLATEERKSLIPIQSMSIRDMHENVSSNIIDAITNLPGVTAVTTGPSISKPVIRGLGYNRIITLNDGVRQEGQQWGDEHGIEIDDYNVSRVEVLKGPASLAYGSDALAGVINVISTPDIPDGKIKGNITGNYQFNPGLSALHTDVGGNKNGLSWKLYATQKDAHDYKNKYDGYVYNTRFHNTDYGASLGINRSWGSSRVSYSSFDEKTGIPEGIRDSVTGNFLKEINVNGPVLSQITSDDNTSFAMAVPYQHINHQKVVLDNNLYLGNGGRLALLLGYQRNTRSEFSDVTQPDKAGLLLQLETFTYDLKYYLNDIKGWHVSAGANGLSQWNTNLGDEFLIPDYKLFDIGIYGLAKKDWKKWTVSGGVRYNFRTVSAYQKVQDVIYLQPNTSQAVTVPFDLFVPFTANFSNFSGSMGIGYNMTNRSIVKLNLASGYRSPNIAELSANGIHDGTLRYEYGSAKLTSENSLQADLGMSWSDDYIMVNLAVFDNYIKNFIFIRKLNAINGADSIPVYNNEQSFSAFAYNQADANLYGGEVYVDLHPHPFDWLHLENTFSYVRGQLLHPIEGNDNLPYMPPTRWLLGLRAQKKSLGKYLKNSYAKITFDNNSAQTNVFTPYGTETTNPGYTLLDAGIGADITNKKHQVLFSISIAAQNLTDVAYQNALSRLRYAETNQATGRPGIYNMGRNFSLMLSIPIDVK